MTNDCRTISECELCQKLQQSTADTMTVHLKRIERKQDMMIGVMGTALLTSVGYFVKMFI